MKSRIRRFLLSVSLATSSLAFPLSSSLWSHDLPTSWASSANSAPSWNQLLDECLDQSQMAGPRSLEEAERAVRNGTEDWASSCPAEWTQTLRSGGYPVASTLDADMLARNPLSRFSKEMTCWVNEWQDFHESTVASSDDLELKFAALPDEGQPPAPGLGEVDASQFVTTLDGFTSISDDELAASDNGSTYEAQGDDTCAFDSEYQARQQAADLLAAEMARAAEVAANQSRLMQALSDAEAIEMCSDIDTFSPESYPAESLTGHLVEKKVAQPTRCGGPVEEIISQNCFPNRFAPGIVDEYLAYDLSEMDSHWLGGLGKNWRVNAALSANRNSSSAPSGNVAPAVVSDYVSPESYIAPDSTLDPWSEGVAKYTPVDSSETGELNSYLDRLLDQAHAQTLAMISDARRASLPLAQSLEEVPESLSESMPTISEQLAWACDWIESQQCLVSAELCGYEHHYNLGRFIATSSLSLTQAGASNYLAMGHYLDLPPVVEDPEQPSLVVVYEDADGSQMIVPSSIARAWNRPEVEAEAELAEPTAGESQDLVDLDQVRDHVIAYMAQQLDWIGMACLQTSDQLASWAKVAGRKDAYGVR